jgi:hypothetical protein
VSQRGLPQELQRARCRGTASRDGPATFAKAPALTRQASPPQRAPLVWTSFELAEEHVEALAGFGERSRFVDLVGVDAEGDAGICMAESAGDVGHIVACANEHGAVPVP